MDSGEEREMESQDRAGRDRLTVLLIRYAAILDEVVAIAEGRPVSSMAYKEELPSLQLFPPENQRAILKRWLTVFNDEITTVRLVRNSLVHRSTDEISDENLKNATETAESLIEILRRMPAK